MFSSGTLEIREGEGPSGALLMSIPIVSPVADEFNLHEPGAFASVIQGQTYSMRIIGDADFDWGYNTSDPYAGGESELGGVNDHLFFMRSQGPCVHVNSQVLSLNDDNEISLLEVDEIVFADGTIQTTSGSRNHAFDFADNTLSITDDGGALEVDLSDLRRIDDEFAISRSECILSGELDTSAQLNAAGFTSSSSSQFWQSFTTNSQGELGRVSFHTSGPAVAFIGTVSIYAGQGTGGELLYTQALDFELPATNWAPLNLDSPVYVEANTQYTFQVQSDVGSIANAIHLTNNYSGGRASAGANKDYMFNTRIAVCEDTLIPVLQSSDSGALEFFVDSLSFSDGSVQYSAFDPSTFLDTDDQTLSLSGSSLAISEGNTVDLSGLGSSDQDLSLSGNDLSISGGNTVDLSALIVGSDDQTLGLSGTTLSITDGNSVNLNGINTDEQDLSLSGNTLTISGGNNVNLASITPTGMIVDTTVGNSEGSGQAADIDITGQLEVTGEVQTYGNVKLGGTGDPSPPTITIGSNGSALNSIIKVTKSIDLPNISGNDIHFQNVTVTNASVGATVFVSPAGQLSGSLLIGYARVSANNTVQIAFLNEGSSGQNMGAMNYYITVIQ